MRAFGWFIITLLLGACSADKPSKKCIYKVKYYKSSSMTVVHLPPLLILNSPEAATFNYLSYSGIYIYLPV